MTEPTPEITDLDRAKIAAAADQLENPGLAGQLADAVGTPVEKLLERLPTSIQDTINKGTEKALDAALAAAIRTVDEDGKATKPWNTTHKVAATLSGIAGGFFGLPALVAELPVTTGIMLRSIIDIARSKGEDVTDPEVQLACLEVFALGSAGPEKATKEAVEQADIEDEKFAEAGYYIARAALAHQVKTAVAALSKGSLPGLPSVAGKVISKITTRFGIAVSEKAAAQAVPILGAVGGGLVNALFMSHYQDVAEAHFTVRAMERQYGEEAVRAVFEKTANAV